jgi:hypothetical protein
MAELRIPGFPKLGHCDTWKVDRSQLLVERNHKKRLHPSLNNASSDDRDMDESFVTTVALHSEELHLALVLKASKIEDKVKKDFSSDQKFMCRAMGVDVPFLLVSCADEYTFFTRLLLQEMRRFDPEEMALKWIASVEGVKVFPKLSAQLNAYHKKWEHNRRVQVAVNNMKSDIDALAGSTKARYQRSWWKLPLSLLRHMRLMLLRPALLPVRT